MLASLMNKLGRRNLIIYSVLLVVGGVMGYFACLAFMECPIHKPPSCQLAAPVQQSQVLQTPPISLDGAAVCATTTTTTTTTTTPKTTGGEPMPAPVVQLATAEQEPVVIQTPAEDTADIVDIDVETVTPE